MQAGGTGAKRGTRSGTVSEEQGIIRDPHLEAGQESGYRYFCKLQKIPFFWLGEPFAPCSRGRIELLVMLPLPFPTAE